MSITHEDDAGKTQKASASLHITIGNAEKIISVRGRIADLIVMCRNNRDSLLSGEVINAALFHTGRPVLLVPPGESAKPLNGNVVIAWNGSREAVHAVIGGMPFLQEGKVWAVSGLSDHWEEPPILPRDLTGYLQQHGIKAEPLEPWINETTLPKAILNSAKKLDAGLIIMGAYSHSRMREMILGGVTEHMLKHADIPVLMMH